MLSSIGEIERSIITKFRKSIYRPFTKGIKDYEMIQENDKIAVCISGGKDSMLLAKCMEELQKHGNVKFELVYLMMDPGYNQANYDQVIKNAKILGIDLTIFKSDIFEIVDNVGGSPCYLCARMRRGSLYSKAQELGCNKIALGHHFDDVIETTMLSMLYGGEIKGMMPKLHSTNFSNMELIRPFYLVRERDIINFSKYNNLNFINCACKFVSDVNSGKNDSKRKEMKQLISNLEKVYPNVSNNIFRSLENVNIDTMIGIKKDGEKISFLENYGKK